MLYDWWLILALVNPAGHLQPPAFVKMPDEQHCWEAAQAFHKVQKIPQGMIGYVAGCGKRTHQVEAPQDHQSPGESEVDGDGDDKL